MTMKPDIENAALKATETLVKYHVTTAPVVPLPILKKMPGVLVVSFAEMAQKIGIERQNVVSAFSENQDGVTSVINANGELRYVVAYNQRLPFYMLQRALARELAHIVLKHDGTKPEEVRAEESLYFARHFLCPRPLLHALHESGTKLTIEVIGNVTGCYERCLAGLRKTPGAHVPAELNRLVRDQFSDYVTNFVAYQTFIANDDETALADLGSFMDNYAE